MSEDDKAIHVRFTSGEPTHDWRRHRDGREEFVDYGPEECVMSEPKPERITEAELRRMESPHPYESDVRPLVAEVRRLRGLIDFYGLKLPPQVEIAKSAALVAEAEAIRAERG